jgi:hypothetical protein
VKQPHASYAFVEEHDFSRAARGLGETSFSPMDYSFTALPRMARRMSGNLGKIAEYFNHAR